MSWLSEAIGTIFDPGKSSRDEANALSQQALSSQQGQESWQRGLLQDRLGIANNLLFGGNVQKPGSQVGGVNSAPGTDVTGALPQSQEWENRFFEFLNKAPDTTYNRQRDVLDRSMKEAERYLTSNLNKRGIQNTTLGASQFGSLGLERSKALSDLEGQRIDRQGQNIATGTQLAGGILDRALNMGNNASGMVNNFNTRVPDMLNFQSQNAQSQANAAGNGIGSQLVSQASQNIFDRLFPQKQMPANNGQSAGGVGQTLLGYVPKLFGF